MMANCTVTISLQILVSSSASREASRGSRCAIAVSSANHEADGVARSVLHQPRRDGGGVWHLFARATERQLRCEHPHSLQRRSSKPRLNFAHTGRVHAQAARRRQRPRTRGRRMRGRWSSSTPAFGSTPARRSRRSSRTSAAGTSSRECWSRRVARRSPSHTLPTRPPGSDPALIRRTAPLSPPARTAPPRPSRARLLTAADANRRRHRTRSRTRCSRPST